MAERGKEAIVSHQVRSKVCIFDAELGLSIFARRRALETVTMTTRHSTTALTCRQRTTASTWPPANRRRAAADPLSLQLTCRGGKVQPPAQAAGNQFSVMCITSSFSCSLPVPLNQEKIKYRKNMDRKCKNWSTSLAPIPLEQAWNYVPHLVLVLKSTAFCILEVL